MSEQTVPLNTKKCTVMAPAGPAGTDSLQGAAAVNWAALAAQIQAGDEGAMEQIHRVFSQGLRFLLLRQLGPQNHEAILQETFLLTVRALRHGELRQPECLPGFIRTIAQRQVAKHIEQNVHARNRESQLDTGLTVSDRKFDPEQENLLREKIGIMKKALATLRSRDREILVRSYSAGNRPSRSAAR